MTKTRVPRATRSTNRPASEPESGIVQGRRSHNFKEPAMHCCFFKTLGQLCVALALATCGSAVAADKVAPPPNGPAEVRWDAQSRTLSLRYHGATILDAVVSVQDAAGQEVRVLPSSSNPRKPAMTRRKWSSV